MDWTTGPDNSACKHVVSPSAVFTMVVARAHYAIVGGKVGGWRWEVTDDSGVIEAGYTATREDALAAADKSHSGRAGKGIKGFTDTL